MNNLVWPCINISLFYIDFFFAKGLQTGFQIKLESWCLGGVNTLFELKAVRKVSSDSVKSLQYTLYSLCTVFKYSKFHNFILSYCCQYFSFIIEKKGVKVYSMGYVCFRRYTKHNFNRESNEIDSKWKGIIIISL